mmetsp:Transcript_30901/g.77396  ORF Transcript_30901/g.77396 Transcript_30901/m.77396 type:complete len:231 (+) Transcript_30901:712-1404(+)
MIIGVGTATAGGMDVGARSDGIIPSGRALTPLGRWLSHTLPRKVTRRPLPSLHPLVSGTPSALDPASTAASPRLAVPRTPSTPGNGGGSGSKGGGGGGGTGIGTISRSTPCSSRPSNTICLPTSGKLAQAAVAAGAAGSAAGALNPPCLASVGTVRPSNNTVGACGSPPPPPPPSVRYVTVERCGCTKIPAEMRISSSLSQCSCRLGRLCTHHSIPLVLGSKSSASQAET